MPGMGMPGQPGMPGMVPGMPGMGKGGFPGQAPFAAPGMPPGMPPPMGGMPGKGMPSQMVRRSQSFGPRVGQHFTKDCLFVSRSFGGILKGEKKILPNGRKLILAVFVDSRDPFVVKIWRIHIWQTSTPRRTAQVMPGQGAPWSSGGADACL